MLATLVTAVINGLRGELVHVEVDVAPGLPVCHIVGLPDAALSEARERVRGAIRNAGFEYPLAPHHRQPRAGRPAQARRRVRPGHRHRHPGRVGPDPAAAAGRGRCSGELSLGGSVQPVPGVLPMVATLARAGPPPRRGAASRTSTRRGMVEGVEVVGVDGLDDAARLVAGPRGRTAARRGDVRRAPLRVSRATATTPRRRAAAPSRPGRPADLADVRGQPMARWALEVALAGGHDLLLVGSPGAGKTLLARTVPGLLPPLDDEEAQEVAVIRSVAGLRRRCRPSGTSDPSERRITRPRYAAMVGGGPHLQPGLVTLAHRGVLFLDELAEFDRDVLDALRQPLEDGTVEIVRAHGHVRYPARLQLIAAMNPCRCGWHGRRTGRCRCAPEEADRYVRRVSGPLARPDRPAGGRAPGPARGAPRRDPGRALERSSPRASPRPVSWRCGTVGGHQRALAGAAAARRMPARPAGPAVADATWRPTRAMTARGIHRALRVARTIADLAGHEPWWRRTLAAAVDPARGRRGPARGMSTLAARRAMRGSPLRRSTAWARPCCPGCVPPSAARPSCSNAPAADPARFARS